MNWLQRLLGREEDDQEGEKEAHTQSKSQDDNAQIKTIASNRMRADAFIQKVQAKIDRLVEDFAEGTVNQAQFQKLYSHYQNQVQAINAALEQEPTSWQQYASEGKSMVIRRRHSARAKAYAIYDNLSGLPLSTLGTFTLDPGLFIPMLSSFRSATREIFGAGIQTTQIEGEQWLCFVPGEYTTMLALFTNQPAAKQLDFLGKLHAEFETANRIHLQDQPIDKSKLVFPHEYYLGKWQT